jgi:hypothetical protein
MSEIDPENTVLDDQLSEEKSGFLRFLAPGTPGAGQYWLVAGVALLAVFLYVLMASTTGRTGLPLDDSWIHQTYARNLAANGRWEFVPGSVSAGSTAPLWSLLLALGYMAGAPYLLWTYSLGWLLLLWTAWAAMALWRCLWPDYERTAWLPGLVIVLSWPLIWAAASGMETLLFTALAMSLIFFYTRQANEGRWKAAPLGLLSGLLIVARPDGLGLFLLIALGLFLAGGSWRERLSRGGVFLLAAALPLLPYFSLNLLAGGHLWPGTLYAKQAEYALLWTQALPLRFSRLLYFSLGGPDSGWRGMTGARLLLLPGLLISFYFSMRSDFVKRRLFFLLPLLWAVGHIFLYSWRLPVTYQHGRYLLPVVPIIILYGLAGWMWLFRRLDKMAGEGSRPAFILKSVARLTFATLLLFFLFLGMRVYAQDVAFINGEMVAVAEWLQKNTGPDDLIAAHDIGAIGYFSNRPLLDLAGLISPEVIPLLPDQDAVAEFAKGSDADYLVTAPGWPYSALNNDPLAQIVYSTDFLWTIDQGLNNMTVYALSTNR